MGLKMKLKLRFGAIPANIYLFEFNYENTIKRCEISSKLTIKTFYPVDTANNKNVLPRRHRT